MADMQRSVAKCILSRATRAWCGRVGGAVRASLALITALAWSVAPTSAQQCTPTGTNQTCTNSIFLTGGAIGLFDNGVPPGPGLTVTNTSVGTISGTGGAVASAFGIQAATATVTNNGTISGTTALAGGEGAGVNAATASVANNGTISGTGGPTGLGFGISATTQTVTNNGTISGTGGMAGIGIVALGLSTATVTNNGTISGTTSGTGAGSVGFGVDAATATVTNNGTISGTASGVASGFGIVADTATVTNNGTILGTSGVGGSGIGINSLGAGSNVTNNGTITGTTFAIDFAGGGGNTLTLGPTSIINGEVIASGANNLLQLGGSGIGSFDVSLVGPAAQYRGFDTFNKVGDATWTLTGFNAGALPWTVQQGILLVNGSLANSPFAVSGGTLGGIGTIGNTQVNSGGTLAPGSGAPGTSLTINGNLAFQSGALYLVQVNSSTASFANVTATASLAGTVQANIASATHKPYDILHSAALGGSRFNALVLTNPNFSGGLSLHRDRRVLDPDRQSRCRDQSQSESAERRQRTEQCLQLRWHAAARFCGPVRTDWRQSGECAVAARR